MSHKIDIIQNFTPRAAQAQGLSSVP